MANIDRTLRRVLTISIFVCLVTVWIVAYFHFAAKARQGQREITYLHARQLAAQERNERLEKFKKNLEQERRKNEFNKGRIIDYENRK